MRKRFGQHFLAPAWADKVVRAIAPTRDDRFLEIGPGAGALTLRLAPRVEHLTAIEIDRDLAAALQPQLPPHVDLIVADFLDVDLAPFLAAGPLRIAGNLPYNLSSPILFKLLAAAGPNLLASAGPNRPGLPSAGLAAAGPNRPGLQPAGLAAAGPERPGLQPAGLQPEGRADLSGPPSGLIDATVMLQLEVAERLVARPETKDYGVLTIFTALHAEVRQVLTLPPGAFRPAPRVHSAVVRLTFKPSPLPEGSQGAFEKMVRTMFMQRRKTLLNALRPFAESMGRDCREALAEAAIDPIRRPETLTQTDLLRLVSAFPPKA